MVMQFFTGGADQLESVVGEVQDMLSDCRHTFNAAMNALVGGTDPAAVGKDIRKTDRGINKAERRIRRQLLIHASTRGADADIATVMILMSVAKDIERIGDYAKNIWDLSDNGVNLSEEPDIKHLRQHRDQTSSLIADTARIFVEQDADRAHELLQTGDALLDELDDHVTSLVTDDGSPRTAVPRALLYRYLKRINAHLMNVLSSIVMPVDRLDYYDEDKADRI